MSKITAETSSVFGAKSEIVAVPRPESRFAEFRKIADPKAVVTKELRKEVEFMADGSEKETTKTVLKAVNLPTPLDRMWVDPKSTVVISAEEKESKKKGGSIFFAHTVAFMGKTAKGVPCVAYCDLITNDEPLVVGEPIPESAPDKAWFLCASARYYTDADGEIVAKGSWKLLELAVQA
jgi:hypothetical protein